MIIKGKAHCLFEQSGTFKKEFIKLGIPAEDYDIQNNFGQTDHVVDLFGEIENAYDGKASVFDSFTKDDFVIAFFPCIYFSCLSQMQMSFTCVNFVKKTQHEKCDAVLERSRNREKFFRLFTKLLDIALERGLRMVVENPYSMQSFLKNNAPIPPRIIDMNRMHRGDFFEKPTAYWCLNFEPTNGFTYQNDKVQKTILNAKKGKYAGICSEERSMIHPDYARNFICDFIIGKKQDIGQLSLF